ncbi:unnamed protein product [Discosporangium mesarthrocarpum]
MWAFPSRRCHQATNKARECRLWLHPHRETSRPFHREGNCRDQHLLGDRLRSRGHSDSNRRLTGESASKLHQSRGNEGFGSDQAALLRRVARYIEEDNAAAEELGKAITPEAGRNLSVTLGRLEYSVLEPSARDLRRVALISAIPFVGFGIMDNAIMIVAGEYIDFTLGVAMGISTMAAAALGNTISDVAGVGLGGFIQDLASKLGLPDPNLSRAQMQLRKTRLAGHVGCALGVTVGCLIGMFPLLFMPSSDSLDTIKRKEKIVNLIDAVMKEATSFLSASSVTLFILDSVEGTLWARGQEHPTGEAKDLKVYVADGSPVAVAARNGTTVNIERGQGGSAPMLIMPVFGADGHVAGVVQVLDKRGVGDSAGIRFTKEDERDLSALCSHISVALEKIKHADDHEVGLADTIALMKTHGKLAEASHMSKNQSARRSQSGELK